MKAHRLLFRLLRVTFVACFMTQVPLQAQILVSGPNTQVEEKEIREDLERANAQARQSLSAPEAMHNNVSNIYVRRVLAKEAEKAGLEKNPLVNSALSKARDKILSDAMLEKIDINNQPNLKDIEAFAQTNYKVNSKRFETQEEVRVSHILVKTAEPDAKFKATEIYQQLKAGADFVALAKAKSQDPGSATKGGDLGYFSKGKMLQVFEDTAFAMKDIGSISEVIESPFGFHVIKLEGRKPAGIRPFSEVKDILMREAENTILNQGRAKEEQRILKEAQFNTEAIAKFAKEQAAKP